MEDQEQYQIGLALKTVATGRSEFGELLREVDAGALVERLYALDRKTLRAIVLDRVVAERGRLTEER